MSRKPRPPSTINQDTPPITQNSTIAHSSAKHFAKSSTRDQIASRFDPVGPLITITETPGLDQHINTQLHYPNMSKRHAETLLNHKPTPKKPKATKKTADIEVTPINANDRSSASKTTTSTEEEATSLMGDDEDTPPVSEEVASTPQKKKGAKASAPKKGSKAVVPKAKAKKPPVGDGFNPYVHNIQKPASDPFWGRKRVPGDPRPHPDQPSARASNGQTNPPLFEDRGYRYKRGARYVKHHYNVEPANVDQLLPNRDQEDLLAVPLIDMRPKSRNDPEPKRIPDVYCYKKVPKDWNCKQSIKALNDRRYQAIDRMTMDGKWTRIEQEYLASLLRENPDASIWELTELHNDRFMGKDFKEDSGLDMGNWSTGRTVESVRYQYTAYKPFYDRGKVPVVRWRGDKSAEGIALSKLLVEKFGPPSKSEELAHDKAHGGTESDDDDDTPKKRSPKKKKSKTVDESDAFDAPVSRKRRASEESEDDERPAKQLKTRNADPFPGQDKLDDDEEELLALAGCYGDEDALPSSQEDDDAEQTEEMTEGQDSDAEIQVDSDVHATHNIEVDENYDDEV